MIKNLTIIFLSTFVSLILVEITLRIFEIGYGNAPFERSRTYHHVHPINYQFLMHDPNGEYGGHNVFYDDAGFRVGKKSSSTISLKNKTNTILFLGDSYTEGNQVSYQDTFVSQVSQNLDKHSVNFGVSSYSTIFYLLQAKNILPEYKADTVILQLFSNDFASDIGYLKNAVIVDDEVIAIDGGENDDLRSILRKSYLVRFIRQVQLLFLTVTETDSAVTNTTSNSQMYIPSVPDDQISNTITILLEINKLLKQQGKSLHIFLIPNVVITREGSCCDLDNLYMRFYKELEIAGLETIDVRTEFENSNQQKDLYFKHDIHLSKTGHSLIANSIISHLKKDN